MHCALFSKKSYFLGRCYIGTFYNSRISCSTFNFRTLTVKTGGLFDMFAWKSSKRYPVFLHHQIYQWNLCKHLAFSYNIESIWFLCPSQPSFNHFTKILTALHYCATKFINCIEIIICIWELQTSLQFNPQDDI